MIMRSPKSNHITITPYNSSWPQLFEAEALGVKKALGESCVAVHHVGSTAVPGLSAKPTIDIIVVVKAESHCHCEARSNPFLIIKSMIFWIASSCLRTPRNDRVFMDPSLRWGDNRERENSSLIPLGYIYKGECNIPMHYGFAKRGDVDVNLHLYEEGHAEIKLNLMFRDYLRANDIARDEYGSLKARLLQNPDSFKKNGAMFTGYNLGKNAFISDILQKAGFDRLRMVRAVHYNEVKAANYFRQKYCFDQVLIEDPCLLTFDHMNHEHLILYKGTDIVGYAHLQFWPEGRAAMRIIVIDENKRKLHYGSEFMTLIEKYVKLKGYKSLQVASTPEVLVFYQKHGYSKMLFNDPDSYQIASRYIVIGKIL